MKFSELNRLLAVALVSLPSALLAADVDMDGLDDAFETNTGTYVSPTNTGTSPAKADSDGDGAGDWYEVTASFTNPNGAASKPNIPYPLPAPDAGTGATNKPVKVFILSGQSNMEGQGNISPQGTAGTLETITKNQYKFPNLLNGANWSVRNDVRYRGVIAAIKDELLTAGEGTSSTAIGPELGFGHVMGYYHGEPVLILKSSEGGKSLGGDFLPPGSVQYTYGSETFPAFGQSPVSWLTGTTPVNDPAFYGGIQFDKCFRNEADWAPAGATLPAVTNVTDVLDNFATQYPQWAAQGFEIAGFAWFQGWNDGLSYTGQYAYRYGQNMAQFIRQIRAYYEGRYPGKIKPKAPFAVATCGFGGYDTTYPTRVAVVDGQFAVGNPALYPEFAGNVITMDARSYWRDAAVSPADQGYHYNRNSETFMLVGDALGRGMIDLLNAASSASAGQIWDGGSSGPGDNNWNTAANWDSDILPTFTNAITFVGNTRNAPVNNLAADSTIGGIDFTNDGSTGKTNAFTLSGARITLGGNVNTTANATGSTITDTISLNMILNGDRAITMNQLSSSVQHNLTISGIISQDGSNRTLIKQGSGRLSLTVANSYAGGTTISAGSIRVTNSAALGTGSVSVASGGFLFLDLNGLTVANDIELNGISADAAINNNAPTGGNVTNLTGKITLNTTSNITTHWNDKTLQLSGKITGAGGLNFDLNTRSGAVGGRYLISGATNDYAGATSITGRSTPNFGFTGQAMLYLGATNALPTTTALTLNYADLYLNGQSQTLPSISGSGSYSVQNGSTTAATLTLGSGDTTSTFSGTIKDNGISVTNTLATPATVTGTVALTKTGNGTLTLNNSNTYSGTTSINSGTLVITGATQATSAITFGGGKLGLDIASSVTAASATINFTGQSVLVGGAPTLASYTLLTANSITGTPTLAAPAPAGYELKVESSNTLKLVKLGYASWAALNGAGPNLNDDHDNDGVPNGIEFFIHGPVANSGFTPLPGVTNTGGTLSVTWTKATGYTGSYPTDFVVETSAALAGPWTPETLGGTVTITGPNNEFVTYTYPGGPAYSGRKFARLKVTGP